MNNTQQITVWSEMVGGDAPALVAGDLSAWTETERQTYDEGTVTVYRYDGGDNDLPPEYVAVVEGERGTVVTDIPHAWGYDDVLAALEVAAEGDA